VNSKPSRRTILKGAVAASIAAVLAGVAEAGRGTPVARSNIILYISDQFRWEFVGANGSND